MQSPEVCITLVNKLKTDKNLPIKCLQICKDINLNKTRHIGKKRNENCSLKCFCWRSRKTKFDQNILRWKIGQNIMMKISENNSVCQRWLLNDSMWTQWFALHHSNLKSYLARFVILQKFTRASKNKIAIVL